jgi:hypothetical protein
MREKNSLKEEIEMEIKNEVLRKAYEGSYYTIIGCGGDLKEWKKGYQKMLNERTIGKITEWLEFTGKDMNEEFEIKDKYKDDLHFLAFSLDGLDIGKLAMFKLMMGDRWFDDVVDNLVRNEM